METMLAFFKHALTHSSARFGLGYVKRQAIPIHRRVNKKAPRRTEARKIMATDLNDAVKTLAQAESTARARLLAY